MNIIGAEAVRTASRGFTSSADYEAEVFPAVIPEISIEGNLPNESKDLSEGGIARIDACSDSQDLSSKIEGALRAGAEIVVVDSRVRGEVRALEVLFSPFISEDVPSQFTESLSPLLAALPIQASEDVSTDFRELMQEIGSMNERWRIDAESVIKFSKQSGAVVVSLPERVSAIVAGFVATEVPVVMLPMEQHPDFRARVTILVTDQVLRDTEDGRGLYSAIAVAAGIPDNFVNYRRRVVNSESKDRPRDRKTQDKTCEEIAEEGVEKVAEQPIPQQVEIEQQSRISAEQCLTAASEFVKAKLPEATAPEKKPRQQERILSPEEYSELEQRLRSKGILL